MLKQQKLTAQSKPKSPERKRANNVPSGRIPSIPNNTIIWTMKRISNPASPEREIDCLSSNSTSIFPTRMKNGLETKEKQGWEKNWGKHPQNNGGVRRERRSWQNVNISRRDRDSAHVWKSRDAALNNDFYLFSLYFIPVGTFGEGKEGRGEMKWRTVERFFEELRTGTWWITSGPVWNLKTRCMGVMEISTIFLSSNMSSIGYFIV